MSDLELRTSRHLPGTPEEAFDAYTDAEKQKIWLSILDEEPGIVEIEVDLRVGACWGSVDWQTARAPSGWRSRPAASPGTPHRAW